MTLRVTIQPSGDHVGMYPVFYALDNGVQVGAAGELMLVSERSMDEANAEGRGVPIEFRIYAPGTWKEVNAIRTTDE